MQYKKLTWARVNMAGRNVKFVIQKDSQKQIVHTKKSNCPKEKVFSWLIE